MLLVALLCSVVGVWGVVILVLYVMRVNGGVILWVICAFHRVYVVLPVVILSAVFCVICSLLTFVSDASGDNIMVEGTYGRSIIASGPCYEH